jgi:solute carrier family 35 (UDP-galactose transporter), member B1
MTLVWKLVGGSLGIYTAFLYHGNLEEDLFRYQSPIDGRTFRYVWLLQACESTAALVVGLSGRWSNSSSSSSSSSVMAWNMAPRFWLSGASQVIAKALTSEALATGLSFPVVVLAKSAKIVPVMCGVRMMYDNKRISFQKRMEAFLFELLTSNQAALSSRS